MKRAAFHRLTPSSSHIDSRLIFGSPIFWYLLLRLSTADIMVPFAGELVWQGSPMGSLYSFVSVMLLLLFSHTLLLDRRKRGTSLRLAVLLPTLYLLADLLFNRSYTLGTPLRDTAWGVFSWHLLAKAFDVGLVYTLEGKPPPQWCVPDWIDKDFAGQNGHAKGNANGKGDGKQLAFWQRTPIPSRPKWAIKTDHLPLHWRLLPLPTRSIDQLIWAIDVFTLRRHGTSFLFVNEMRALEWSQKRLEAAAQAQKKESRSSLKKKRYSHISPFGYTETPLIDAVLQFSAVVLAVRYFSNLDIPSTTPFYDLPLMNQLLTSSAVGVVITFASDLPEHIAFAILQRWPFNIPCTAITPYFRNVARSKTLTDMWGVRWHSFSRRDFVRLNALIPIAPNNRVLNVLKSFFWSAVFHSLLFARAVDPPADLSHPNTLIHAFYNCGSFGLFMGQGVLVVFENILAPFIVKSAIYKKCRGNRLSSSILSILQSLYVYGSLIWMARWIVAELVDINVFSKENIHAMSIKRQARYYYSLWKGSL